MPKRSSKSKSQNADQELEINAPGSVDLSGTRVETPQEDKEKNPAAVALGRLGGLKGGKARAAKLTPEQRAEIAKKAAAKRWGHAETEAPDGGSSSSSGA